MALFVVDTLHCNNCFLLTALLTIANVTQLTKHFVYKNLQKSKGLMERNEIFSQM